MGGNKIVTKNKMEGKDEDASFQNQTMNKPLTSSKKVDLADKDIAIDAPLADEDITIDAHLADEDITIGTHLADEHITFGIW